MNELKQIKPRDGAWDIRGLTGSQQTPGKPFAHVSLLHEMALESKEPPPHISGEKANTLKA